MDHLEYSAVGDLNHDGFNDILDIIMLINGIINGIPDDGSWDMGFEPPGPDKEPLGTTTEIGRDPFDKDVEGSEGSIYG